jgi:hypothetical protein
MMENLEEIFGMDEDTALFKDQIIQDLAVAYGLGLDHLEFKVPAYVYKRRLSTSKLFTESIQQDKGIIKFRGKNPFSMLNDETIEKLHAFLKEIKSSSKCSVLKGFYFDDDEEEEYEEMDEEYSEAFNIEGFIITTEEAQFRLPEDNIEQNLASYERIQKEIATGEAQLKNATELFNKAYKGTSLVLSRSNSRNKPAYTKDAGHISFTAKIRIRDEGAKLKTGLLLSKLKTWRSRGMELLEKANNITVSAISGIQSSSLVTQVPLPKLTDLISLIVRCQELEKKIINECVNKENPSCAEFEEELNKMETEVKFFLFEKNYRNHLSANEVNEAAAVESFFNDRLDKIKKTIYSNYNKSRMISRQIWHMKKKSK